MPAQVGYSPNTTDMWVLEVEASWPPTNRIIHAYNVLNPSGLLPSGQPQVYAGTGAPSGGIAATPFDQTIGIPITPSQDGTTPNVRVDIRLKNYGAAPVSLRSESQTVASGIAPDQSCSDPNWVGTQHDTCGKLIVTPYLTVQPNAEIVHSHWFPMWNPQVHTGPMPNGVDQRFWVRNQDYGPTGADCSGSPPWVDCGRAELYDYANSSRHLVHLVVAHPIGPQPTLLVNGASDMATVQDGATVNVAGSGFTPSGMADIFLLDDSQNNVKSIGTGVGSTGEITTTFDLLGGIGTRGQMFAVDRTTQNSSNVVALNITSAQVRYSCVGGACVIASDGQYSTLEDCVSACGTTPTKYSCVDGVCHFDANGQYSSLEECQAACKGTAHWDPTLAAEIGAVAAVATGLVYYGVKRQNRKKK